MKEWDAPKSNKTEAGVELARNIPSTTLGFSWATLGSTCITLPRASPCLVHSSDVLCWSAGFGFRSLSAAGSVLGFVEGSSLGKHWHSDQALRT
jgi:hypothetical protein